VTPENRASVRFKTAAQSGRRRDVGTVPLDGPRRLALDPWYCRYSPRVTQ